jgi:peptidyl-prolyl cis-trans isomerase SurA
MRQTAFTGVIVLAAMTGIAAQGTTGATTPASPPAAVQPVSGAAPAASSDAASSATPPRKGIILDRVLVRVNGEILSQSQLTDEQTDAVRNLPEVQAAKVPLSDAVLQRLIVRVTPDVLVNAVNDLLLVQHGRELGGTFTDDQFKDAIDSLKKQNNLDDAGFKKAMADEGVTLDQLRKNFERAYLRQYAQNEEIFRHMTLTEEELRQYYNTHKDKFMTPETVTLRELAIALPARPASGTNPFGAGTDEAAARAKLDEARTRAEKGEDFAKLVAEYSTSSTKSSGGVIGPINVDDLSEGMVEAIKGLQPGQITQPVRSPTAIQIYKLDARTEPQLQPFDKVRAQIEQAIRTDRLGGETEKLLARLRSEAVIEWKDPALEQMYDKRIAELGGQ